MKMPKCDCYSFAIISCVGDMPFDNWEQEWNNFKIITSIVIRTFTNHTLTRKQGGQRLVHAYTQSFIIFPKLLLNFWKTVLTKVLFDSTHQLKKQQIKHCTALRIMSTLPECHFKDLGSWYSCNEWSYMEVSQSSYVQL